MSISVCRFYPKKINDASLRHEVVTKSPNLTSCPRPPETSLNAVLDAIGELDGGIHYVKSKGVNK